MIHGRDNGGVCQSRLPRIRLKPTASMTFRGRGEMGGTSAMGFFFLLEDMELDESYKWLNQGFKGSLHLGTIPVYVITIGFTLCFVMAV